MCFIDSKLYYFSITDNRQETPFKGGNALCRDINFVRLMTPIKKYIEHELQHPKFSSYNLNLGHYKSIACKLYQ